MSDVWCGEISPIRPKHSAQELLLCVLFFRLVMCDVVRCDVSCLVRCDHVWCVMWWDFAYPAQELGPCLVRCDHVWCVMWWDFAYPAQELGPRTSSLCSLLSACNVWCGEMWCLMSGEMRWCVMCEISPIRPKHSAQELLFCVLFFRLVMCDVVRCDVWCLVRCNDVWCVMWWDFAYPAQALGPRTSSLCSLLSACNVWCGEMWCLMSGEMRWCLMCDVARFRLFGPRTRPMRWCVMCDVVTLRLSGPAGPRTRPKNFFFVFSSFGSWCVKCDVVTCDCVMCDVVPRWCLISGEMQKRCDVVRCDVVLWSVVSRPFHFMMIASCSRFRLFGPRTRPMRWCVMCDVVTLRLSGPSGPRTRPKNFFFVFSSFGSWCVKCDVVTRDCVMCDVVPRWCLISGPWHRHWKLFLFYYFTLFGVSCRDNLGWCSRWQVGEIRILKLILASWSLMILRNHKKHFKTSFEVSHRGLVH